jgi:hypothetical protein
VQRIHEEHEETRRISRSQSLIGNEVQYFFFVPFVNFVDSYSLGFVGVDGDSGFGAEEDVSSEVEDDFGFVALDVDFVSFESEPEFL